jgi:hypothetical protein
LPADGQRTQELWVQAVVQHLAAAAAVNSPYVQAIYTPSKIDGGQVLEYENGLAAANAQMLKNFNTSLVALKPASEAGKNPRGLPSNAH